MVGKYSDAYRLGLELVRRHSYAGADHPSPSTRISAAHDFLQLQKFLCITVHLPTSRSKLFGFVWTLQRHRLYKSTGMLRIERSGLLIKILFHAIGRANNCLLVFFSVTHYVMHARFSAS